MSSISSQIIPVQGYGLQAIERIYAQVRFPISRDELIVRTGTQVLEFEHGERVELRKLLQECTRKDFKDAVDVVELIVEELCARENRRAVA